ncbi:MAG: hypothetical protein HC897_14510 [Thermoanaerobaculia bacterium]|nr:hypothetical protein [Thermoanaerobaculia bacterium]
MNTLPIQPAATPAQASAQRIADEHRALGTTVHQLETTTDLRQLIPLLQTLRVQLEAHFASEEGDDGLEEAISSDAPHLLSSLQHIFDDHRAFLAHLDDLSAKTRACLDGPVAEILAGSVQLAQDLRAHEERETELLNDALYTDFGRGQ